MEQEEFNKLIQEIEDYPAGQNCLSGGLIEKLNQIKDRGNCGQDSLNRLLHLLAVKIDSNELIERIIAAGADVNSADDDGNTKNNAGETPSDLISLMQKGPITLPKETKKKIITLLEGVEQDLARQGAVIGLATGIVGGLAIALPLALTGPLQNMKPIAAAITGIVILSAIMNQV